MARIVEDVARLATDPIHRRTVESILGRSPVWNAKRSIELGLTDWHSHPSQQAFSFTDDDLSRVSDAMSRRLTHCQPPDPVSDVSLLAAATVQVTLENKLLSYFKFDPLLLLLVDTLRKAGYQSVRPVGVITCFAEAAINRGVRLDRRSGGTRVLRVGDCLIKWQSVSDAGRDHKKKELCGRAVGLRYTWDPLVGKYVQRPGVSKLMLVIDGTWRQSDLAALSRAGWDRIFYPDELDQLIDSI